MRVIRRSALVLLLAAAAAGCGGDEEEATTQAQPPPAATTQATTTEATTETERETTERERERAEEPEQDEGGAGDEEAIRSEAVFTGRGGKLSPPLVQVPPFIAVEVRVRSADGGDYSLRIGGKTIEAGESALLEGLRPGESYRGGGVEVEASAEPGP